MDAAWSKNAVEAVMRWLDAHRAACPEGSFSGPQASSCEGCLPGSYAAHKNATACEPCQPGTHAARRNATGCDACPSGSVSPGNAANCTVCTAGWYASEDGVECVPRPAPRELCRAPLLFSCGVLPRMLHNIFRELFRAPFLFFKGFHALQAHRVAHWLWQEGRKTLAQFFQNQISVTLGVDFRPAARIGGGVMLDHATGIVIGETAVIEDDVSGPKQSFEKTV